MKLEYKILWLDDYIQDFIDLEAIEEIEKHLVANGFIPKVKTVKKSSDFFALLDDSFDLILTDFHMNDMNGDEVVEKIRSSKYSVMTEILFYTAKADLKDTQKISRVSFLETNASTDEHIERVISRTIELIDLTIKKFQHIVTMRGMIMHETSSLDVEFTEILEKFITGNEDAINKIKERFKKFNSDNIKESDDLPLNDLLNKIGASHRWKGLKENLNKDEIYNTLLDYEKDIIIIRNNFAHAVLDEDESGRKHFRNKKDGIDFNEEFCKKIREDIIKHKINLDDLKETLK
jgi:CheY-like chemotaxis protein